MKQTSNPTLQIAQTVAATEAEGPGRRFAIWLQGCPLRCPGCCNPEMLPFSGGQTISQNELLGELDAAVARHDVEGVTWLGGEPFAHAAAAAAVSREVRRRGLSVMVFSGFTLAELHDLPDAGVEEFLGHVDILVDGPYRQDQPERLGRRWIGSANQQIHFLTDHYQADDPRWRASNTLEIRLQDGDLSVNGFPAPSAVGVWKRPSVRH